MRSNNQFWLTAIQLAGWSRTAPNYWMNKFLSSTRVFKTWGKITIAVRYQGIGQFTQQEQLILQRSHPKPSLLSNAWIREVEIFVADKSMMVARSVTNYQELTSIWQANRITSNKPIGQTLFSDPKVTRTPYLFANLAVPFNFHQNGKLTTDLPKHWVRRSLFLRYQHPLLLTEWFLPDFMHVMQQLNYQQQQQIVQISKGKQPSKHYN